MAKCFSLTASRDTLLRYTFTSSGLKSTFTNFDDGATTLHCWAPKIHKPSKPSLLLIHGFGANAMWQFSQLIQQFTAKFNVYVPDLIFFGDSFTTWSNRSESFQAECLGRLMVVEFGVKRFSLVGLSYGGFVGYQLAVQFGNIVERVVLCCAGVCLEEKDLMEGLFKVKDLEEAISILLPQTPEKLRVLVKMSFVKPVKGLPSCFLRDFIDVMCTEYIQEKRELLAAVLENRKLSDLARITQPTLIIWGEQDQVFPIELGYRLKSHIGEKAELVVIKGAGHAINMEKPKRFNKLLKDFLMVSISDPSPNKKHIYKKGLNNGWRVCRETHLAVLTNKENQTMESNARSVSGAKED